MDRVAALLAVVYLLHPGAAFAARTDLVLLRNGDRVTGEVKSLNRGQLQIKTDDIGTVTVNWAGVVGLTTAGQFDVEMRDGRRFVGRLDTGAAGELTVAGAAAASPTTLALIDVVSLAPIRSTFLRKIDGSLDLGASYTQSSGVAQMSFDTEATYRRPSFAASAEVSITFTRTEDAPDTTRYAVQVGYTRFRKNLWMVHPLVLVERNVDQGLDLRTTGAVSVGRYLAHSNRGVVVLAGGGALGRERPVDGASVTNVDALVALDASLFSYDFPKTNVDLAVMLFPGLSDPGRVRLNTNAKFKRELFKSFSLGVTGYDTYDNRPPAGGSRNDVGVSLSLGWLF